MKTFGMTAAALSFVFCFVGAAALLNQTRGSFDEKNFLVTGVALYFIGNAIFAGALLAIISGKTKE